MKVQVRALSARRILVRSRCRRRPFHMRVSHARTCAHALRVRRAPAVSTGRASDSMNHTCRSLRHVADPALHGRLGRLTHRLAPLSRHAEHLKQGTNAPNFVLRVGMTMPNHDHHGDACAHRRRSASAAGLSSSTRSGTSRLIVTTARPCRILSRHSPWYTSPSELTYSPHPCRLPWSYSPL
jgi:hypothetical protein